MQNLSVEWMAYTKIVLLQQIYILESSKNAYNF